jgi:hypothetical protein
LYNITLAQALAFFALFTVLWSFKVAMSHVRMPSKATLQRIVYIQLCGSFSYGIFKGLSDPKDFALILNPLIWVPIVLIVAWIAVKAFNLASTAYKYTYSRYDNMPDYQTNQDGAEKELDPRIIRFVDGAGNTCYRVDHEKFYTLYSAKSYLDRLKNT